MPDKREIVKQTSLAFDFISKLYLEVSYLIKEIEGLLYQEEEKFIIGRPAGYGITARKTTGLDANNLSLWLMRKFAVFFIPEEQTKKEKGQTITAIDEKLKVLYLRFILDGDEVKAPTIYSGILHKIDKKPQAKGIKKFEHIMGHLEYNDLKIFKNIECALKEVYQSVNSLHESDWPPYISSDTETSEERKRTC